MIEEIVRILKSQLDGFHRKIENNPKDARLQAQYWELIVQHEEIISKAMGAVLSEQYNKPKKKGNYTRSEKSIRVENSIYNAIESNGGTATRSQIADSLQLAEHRVNYYMTILIDDKRIVKTRQGTYAINSQNGATK